MNELEQMYQEIILDAARERHGEGEIEDPDGESFQVNPTCGDQVNYQVNMEDGRYTDLAWTGHGCSISQASISMMTELVENKSAADFEKLYDTFRRMMDSRGAEISDEDADLLEDASSLHGVAKFPMRIKCALLGWMALKDATMQANE
ncbi:Fe-S cluster assembly sulfur transfer protein SufU [Trueperella bialowiezensis]|uniref:NifU-like protein n=1 Tax=Trueperella bialowiezensis TaxID=312285 RepID=A0A448PBK1_9ACTO|nr:SUF system NifU family Fe-S cluster assembly protein [Trueperella bialowiezensis]VEI12345.1 NifU-like protein [Trueperella bialowiezensis]